MVKRFHKRALRKTVFREIRDSLGRYLAIVGIIALGSGLFAGLKVTNTAMIYTGDRYLRDSAFFDLRLVSTLGFDKESPARLSEHPGVSAAEGSVSADFLALIGSQEAVYHALTLTDTVNRPQLQSGRWPESPDECVIDGYSLGTLPLGSVISLSDSNDEETMDLFGVREFTVVGTARSPLYINYERGTTTLGSGSVSGFVLLLPEVFDSDYYTEIYLTFSDTPYIYSDEYDAFSEDAADTVTPLAEAEAMSRYERIVSEAQKELDDACAETADGKREYEDGLRAYEEGRQEYEDNRLKLDQLKQFLGSDRPEIIAAEEELENAARELEDAERELEDVRQQLADAEQEIDDARQELADFEPPDVFVLTRGSNVGYVCFQNDADIVSGIARVFPFFFFAVAALVCITTMNRMVEEERSQIGILKALGYRVRDIMSRYLVYSGSASVIGCALGVVAGSVIFPITIWQAYDIMYNMPEIRLVFDKKLMFLSGGSYLLLALAVTYFSCRSELRQPAAELLRPKAPPPGKRILLERVGFLWKRCRFLVKVSFRNVFRYQKRFIMMVLGIGGCTGLLLTGFGINDSITGIADRQFQEITVYDAEIHFSEDMSSRQQEFIDHCGTSAEEICFLYSASADCSTEQYRGSVTLCAAEDLSQLQNLIRFRAEGSEVSPPGPGTCLISENLAENYGASIGDSITLTVDETQPVTLTVSGIYENVIYNYVYTTLDSLRSSLEELPLKLAYLNIPETADAHAAGAFIADFDGIAALNLTADMNERINNMLSSMKYVVLLIIFCAGALAFIVLFNLTNINVQERIREIATIKVLGFRGGETASYVFRENFILTFCGCLAGIPMGIWLHNFVMAQIKIDMMAFHAVRKPMSYVLSILLTFVFAVCVDRFMRPRLERINMAESLKSIE